MGKRVAVTKVTDQGLEEGPGVSDRDP